MNNLRNKLIILLLFYSGSCLAHNSTEGVSAKQWQNIIQQIAATKYFPQTDKHGLYAANNAQQGWQLHYASDGMTTISSNEYYIGMQLLSVGNLPLKKTPNIEVKDATLYYHHSPQVKEWWTNSADKTEQWFSIKQRPVTGSQEVKINIGIETDTQVSQVNNQLIFTTQQGQNINYNKLKVWDSRGKILPSRMQLADNKESFALIVNDSLATYPITIDPSFSQSHYIKPTVIDDSDFFGWAMDIDGSTMVIGAFNEDSNATTINGDNLDNSAENAGAAYVFVRSGLDWVQQAYLKASDAEAGDNFGISVGVSGNTVVVGAPNEDSVTSNSGTVYVFTRSGTTWREQAVLKSFDPDASAYFGHSVAIDEDTIAVGSYGDDGDANSTMTSPNENAINSGAVHIFTRDGTTWTQESYLKASNAEPFDELGKSVALDGETVVVSAEGEDGDANSTTGAPNNAAVDAGAAYVFVRNSSGWTQQSYLKAHNAGADDGFGFHVAIDADTVVVGVPTEDGDVNSTLNTSNNNSPDAGAAYVFMRTNENWSQQAYLKASNVDDFDNFGYSVAVAGESIVIGAPFEAGDAASTSSLPNNNTWGAGAVYVYTRNDSQWQQKKYLKADNIDVGDYFGTSATIDRGNFLISALYEDGDANSTMTSPNNNRLNAGAVYLFKGRYFVGGTVVGLPFGGTLELFRNGIELLNITDNGNYEFPTDVTANSNYTVSVSSVPSGYTCSIINASGSVGYDDVTDADVFCSSTSYSVAGTVTGLSGAGLVLRNNGVYDVIINSNGSFAFTPDFANGTPYDVVIITQPNNGQTCVVNNGSGTISAGDTNISVVCLDQEFNIGGTVSGLTGTLTLQNNSTNNLILTSNGSFTFTTPITDGNTYAVSILTQPNGQTCTLSNASGTVTGEDVTNVQVNCTNNSYFIGGTVSGLNAAGLVLQNNDADNLPINNNGGFVFSHPLLNNSNYSVTVDSQPNTQTCAVSNGSGTIAGEDVIDVAVNCTDRTYIVGVAVTGLTGPGLVLQNNGGDNLIVNGNGNKQFSNRLSNGSNFNVTILSQPNDPTNRCQIIGPNSGTISGQHVVLPLACSNDTIFFDGFE